MLLLLLLLAGWQQAAGQFFRTVPNGSEFHHVYTPDTTSPGWEQIVSTRIDSVHISGTDTTYFFFDISREKSGLPNNCRQDVRSAPWTGPWMKVNGNHQTRFLNKYGDTILIHPRKWVLGDYSVVQLDSGKVLRAEVAHQYNKLFLDIGDATRVHILQAYDSTGAEVSHPFNGKRLELTWNYGMVTTYNIWEFPYDTTTYQLAGIERYHTDTLLLDTLNVKAWDVFNYQLGDEFHYKRYDISGNAASHSSTLTLEKRMVIDVGHPPFADTLHYDFLRIRLIYATNGAGLTDTSFLLDTISETIYLSEYAFLDKFADEFYKKGRFGTAGIMRMIRTPQYRRRIQKLPEEPYHFDSSNHCLSVNGAQLPRHAYADGLGMTAWFEEDANPAYNYNYDSLIYYQKGVYQWGDPVIFPGMVGVEPEASVSPDIQLYPNPATAAVMIEADQILEPDDRIVLTDLMGKTVWQKQLHHQEKHMLLDVSRFPAGLYLVRILRDGRPLFATRMVKR